MMTKIKYNNFQEIPERLKSYYSVDISFKSLKFVLHTYMRDFALQLNPDFQRGHVWSEEQQISYVEYLLTNPDLDKSMQIIFNCPGWMSSCWKKEMVCVDGLQRITACLRFLNNEIPAYGTFYRDYSGFIRTHLKFIIGAFHKKSDVLKWYLELNGLGTPHTKEELDRVKIMLEKQLESENKVNDL